jgi:hypothetical protein
VRLAVILLPRRLAKMGHLDYDCIFYLVFWGQ